MAEWETAPSAAKNTGDWETAPKMPPKPYRPTGPIPGDPGYIAPQFPAKPQTAGGWLLTQGGGIDPGTAKHQLARDVLTGLESTMGMGPAGGAVGLGAEKVAPIVAKGTKAVGEGVADVIGGIGTHTGGEAIRQAVKAGYEGGKRAELFLANMRGEAPMADVVESARSAVDQMGLARAQAYKLGMGAVSRDASLLNFNAIDRAVDKAIDIGRYKGQVINAEAEKVANQIKEAVDSWKELDPREFHTAEGFDALKRQLNSIWEGTQPHTAARKVVSDVQQAIKDSIADQAPVYAKVMRDYHEASDAIREMEKGLSLGEKSTVDTALRKLQSVMRNNVNTNYGNRLKMAENLDKLSGGQIMPQLAGQALSSATPRGLGLLQAGGLAGYGVEHPWALAELPFQSPRLVGETAYYAGRAARLPGEAAEAIGRTAESGMNWLNNTIGGLFGK